MDTQVVLTLKSGNVNALVNKALKKEVEIKRQPSGKPYIEGGEVCISLSHKDKYLCFALSSGEVGVDIEKMVDRPSIYLIAERYFGEVIQEGDYKAFYAAWTKKEALSKLLGIGLNKELLALDVSKDRVVLENVGEVKFFYNVYGDYLITAACLTDKVEFRKMGRINAEDLK